MDPDQSDANIQHILMQRSQSLDIMSFGDIHSDCLVIQVYDKPYDEVVSCS